MNVQHLDHIGINVIDLQKAKQFFIDLGFTIVGEMSMRGELLDSVTGLKDAQTEFCMVESPDNQIRLEIIKYHHPVDPNGLQLNAPHTLGIRHLALQVTDLDEIVKDLHQKGYTLVGKIENYEDIWKLCYIHGPEGIIVELAEKL